MPDIHYGTNDAGNHAQHTCDLDGVILTAGVQAVRAEREARKKKTEVERGVVDEDEPDRRWRPVSTSGAGPA